jgi:hypothetical protein
MSDWRAKATLPCPEDLFANSVFKVPDYQRGYAWGIQQWEELMEDLELLPEGKQHYTGTLVLHQPDGRHRITDTRGTSYTSYDVVDGQQRLTTIVLLLDAVRRELESLGKKDLAAGLVDRYLYVAGPNGEPIPKLTLNRNIHDFFFRYILRDEVELGGVTVRSHQNLQDARRYFERYLANERSSRDKEYPQWLLALREKVTQRLAHNVYSVDDSAEVGVIFEVMNNRGLPISELDKVKNHLLYACTKLDLPGPPSLPDRINDSWTKLLEELMASDLTSADDEDAVLRTQWLMAYDSDSRSWKGCNSVKKEFHLRKYRGKHRQLLKGLTNYVDTLEQVAIAYCDTTNPTRDKAYANFADDSPLRAKLVRTGEKLRRASGGSVRAHFYPLLAAARLRYPNDGEGLLRTLDLCEKYAFRVYGYLDHRSHTGRTSLHRIGHQLYVKEISLKEAHEALIALIHLYSPDAAMEEEGKFIRDNDWYTYWTVPLRYMLFEYEEHLAGGRPLQVNWADVSDGRKETVEHILPQNPRDPYWRELFDAEARRDCTHDIGNLSLTYDNSSYSNKPFPAKKGSVDQEGRCYANSPLFMERELCSYRDWTPSAVQKRRKKILNWVQQRWLVEPPAHAAGVQPQDDDDGE